MVWQTLGAVVSNVVVDVAEVTFYIDSYDAGGIGNFLFHIGRVFQLERIQIEVV